MSILLAAVQTVAATPVPTPSPTVVTVVHTVTVTPPWVGQLADFLKQSAILLGLIVPGWLASWVHSLVNKSKDGSKRLSQWQNAALLFAYSFVIAGIGLVADSQLNLVNVDFSSPATYGAAFLVVLGAAAARYNKLQLKSDPAPAQTF